MLKIITSVKKRIAKRINFDLISYYIYKLIKKNIKNHKRVLEFGCSTAHITFRLAQENYPVAGLEVLEDVAQMTQQMFKEAGLDTKIYCGNILDHEEKWDLVWNTGILQSLNSDELEIFTAHISKLAPRAIFIVPERKEYTPATKDTTVAVAGCAEYPTGNIPCVLSKFYKRVKIGIWKQKDIRMPEDWYYYICEN